MFETIQENLSNIKNSKVVILTIAILVLLAIVFGLFYINQSRQLSQTSQQPVSQARTLVKNFEDTINLTKISDTPSSSNQIFFFGNDFDNKPQFITQSANFMESGSVFQSKNLFLPDTVYDIGNNSLLINQDKQSFKLDNADGSSVLLAANIFSITPLNEKYFFIQERDNEYVIKRSANLLLSDPQVLITIPKSQINNPDFVQLRLHNDIPYLWTGKINAGGNYDISIYRFGKTIDKKLEFKNVFSTKTGYNKLMVSSVDSANLINTKLIDFANSDTPQISDIDFRQELGQTAKGKAVAGRCAIANGVNKILCLIKQEDTGYFEDSKKDVFVELDLDTQQSKVLYDGFNISANAVFYSPSNKIFIIGQENNLIYRID